MSYRNHSPLPPQQSKKAMLKQRKALEEKRISEREKSRKEYDKQWEEEKRTSKRIEINGERIKHLLWIGGIRKHINEEDILIMRDEEDCHDEYYYYEALRMINYGYDILYPEHKENKIYLRELMLALTDWVKQCELKWGIHTIKKREKKSRILSKIHNKNDHVWVNIGHVKERMYNVHSKVPGEGHLKNYRYHSVNYIGPAKIIFPKVVFQGNTPKVLYKIVKNFMAFCPPQN